MAAALPVVDEDTGAWDPTPTEAVREMYRKSGTAIRQCSPKQFHYVGMATRGKVIGFITAKDCRTDPRRGTWHSAGVDLCFPERLRLEPGAGIKIPTGLRIIMPRDTYARIAPRSHQAKRPEMQIFPGVIDPDYTGELCVVINNTAPDGSAPLEIEAGDPMCQVIFNRVPSQDRLYLVPTELDIGPLTAAPWQRTGNDADLDNPEPSPLSLLDAVFQLGVYGRLDFTPLDVFPHECRAARGFGSTLRAAALKKEH